MNILAADIGGTKSWLSLVATDAENLGNEKGNQTILFEQRYLSNNFSDATALLTQFLRDASAQELKIERMCLALPGVVTEKTSSLTNLDWQLDADNLRETFSIDHIQFINDFEAAALGVRTLDPNDYITLNEGTPEDKAVKVVTGAGTGLGMAWLNYKQDNYYANTSEGGHIDFAPVTTQQIALLEKLMGNYSHVSYERLLSGAGLGTIYDFLKKPSQRSQAANQITAGALQDNELAKKTLAVFVEIYGSYIGNLAVLYKPAGGIYIAGGIAAKILPWMQSSVFLEACFQKGRMRKVVETTPIYLITNDRLGLQGALSEATRSK